MNEQTAFLRKQEGGFVFGVSGVKAIADTIGATPYVMAEVLDEHGATTDGIAETLLGMAETPSEHSSGVSGIAAIPNTSVLVLLGVSATLCRIAEGVSRTSAVLCGVE